MMTRFWRPVALAAAITCLAASARGQSTGTGDLGTGRFLVSSRALDDPNFAKSVVLLIEYNKQGTLGLIINRPTKVPLSKVLTDPNTANKHASDSVYLGGSVDSATVLGLFRSAKKPEDGATAVTGDVYVVSSKGLLEKALAESSGSSDLRLYVGYCGWAPGQLENEVSLGGWWIFDGDAGVIFSPYPDSVWSRLIARTEQQIASARSRPAPFP